MERLNDKDQRKDNLICHSAAGEESHTFTQFLAPTYIGKVIKNLKF
jgi:hypothetical protein